MTTIETIKGQIEELQLWFARKPCNWRETATFGQIQQWADREREQDALIARLEMLEG